MTGKADFTAEEWHQLLETPMVAGMVITLASPAIGDTIKESMAVAKTVSNASLNASGDGLYAELVVEYQDKATLKQSQPKFAKADIETVKTQAMDEVKAAAALLNQRATSEEAAQVKQLYYDVAVATAEAAKEGVFMGIGGVRVNDAEKAALAELATVLNISA
jgi:hypothetical protein